VSRQRVVAFAAAVVAFAIVVPAGARTDGLSDTGDLRAELMRSHREAASLGALDQRLAARLSVPGRTRVVIEPRAVDEARAAVRRAGGRVEAVAAGLVQAAVPNRALAQLAASAAVRRVRPPARPFPLGVPGEGVSTTNASAWHAVGVDGAGVKIAIIDIGFAGLAARQAAGEIPTSAIATPSCSGGIGGSSHGTAVAEVVADEAPGAQLYLLCIDSEVTLAEAEEYAERVGAKVISMSVAFFNTWRGDGRGPVGTPDAVVAKARAAGILWVNGAGNDALDHWGGTYNDVLGVEVHSFTPWGDVLNSLRVPGGNEMCVFLRWDDWPTSTEDYDLGLYDENARVFVARSSANQRAGAPPIEEACYRAAFGARTIGVMITRATGTKRIPALDLFIEGLPVPMNPEYRSPERSITDPAASPNALGVGAICWQSGALEPYSSQGPTIDGRMKPDMVAPDAVSTATFGLFTACGTSGFSGTSAAAPHVAGAAAIVKQAFPSFTAAQLQRYLLSHAGDLGAASGDNVFGAGRLLLPAPDLPPTVQALAARGKPGTRVSLRIRVADDKGEARAGVTVYRGAKAIATLALPFAAAAGRGVERSAPWRATSARGTYRFCAVATDRAGNASERSCAPIRLG
jgi:subtilisin family serine protease